MSEILRFLHDPQAILLSLCLLMFLLGLVRVMNAKNPLEWWHFISTRGEDHRNYADLDKLGKFIGIIISSLIVILLAYNGTLDGVVFGAYLAFVGGVAGYSAYLRARFGGANGNGNGDKK